MYKILIVEDDLTIAKTLSEHFEKWGYQATYIKDFEKVMEEFLKFMPDLVLLDINLPFFNGFHWCSEIRKVSKVPIVFISSANDNMSIVMAMNMGGDDYIEKPFDLNVLTAKVQALIRRTYDFAGSLNIKAHNGLILNLSDASVTYEEENVELTKNEFKILEILIENPGNIVSRDEIINRLWESDDFIDDNTLSVNVARLRKKLETMGLEGAIKTKKGIGYLLEV
ncbi:MAG TPA: response regulator transcription factor [Candidatus Dorea intestinavium]|nr:response regulator transcription factor [Candidatus Dorea intestinavium]